MDSETESALLALGALHAHGYPLDWRKLFNVREESPFLLPLATPALLAPREERALQSKWPFIHQQLESAAHPGERIFTCELDPHR